jgi:hypothetical protein
MNDPRSPGRRGAASDDPVALLRALAQSKRKGPAQSDGPPPESAEAEKLEELRALADKLGRQLQSSEGAPTRGSAAWRGWLAAAGAGWKRFGARLPPLPAWTRHRRRTRLAAAGLGVLVLVGLGALSWGLLRAPEPAAEQIVKPSTPASPGLVTSFDKPPTVDVATIEKAMAACDAEAAKDPDSLFFMVLPMVAADKADQRWASLALQNGANAFLLLSANDALDGLRSSTLLFRPGRYTFAVLDVATGATYSWTSATGLSRLAKKNAGAIPTIRLGFDFSEAQAGTQWGNEFKRERGTCYWVSALVRQ